MVVQRKRPKRGKPPAVVSVTNADALINPNLETVEVSTPGWSLADVCKEPLLMALSQDDLKALLAVSSQLRAVVHSFIQALTIKRDSPLSSPYDVLLLAKGNWKHLQTLVLQQPLGFGEVLDLTRGQLPLLSSLEAHIQGRSTLSFAQFATGKWPLLKALNLSNSCLSPPAMAELKRGKWLPLMQLVLQNCRLVSESIANLTDAKWNRLQLLDLHKNDMEAQDIANLALGPWPNLTTLHAGNLLQPAAWHQLMACTWPKLLSLTFTAEWPELDESLTVAKGLQLSFLRDSHLLNKQMAEQPGKGLPALKHCQIYQPCLHSALAASVTMTWHAKLSKLCLAGCDVSGAALRPVSEKTWPCLQELDLGCVDIDCDGMCFLVWAKMPTLQVLRLDHSNGMNAATFAQLGNSDWPKLESLSLKACIAPLFHHDVESLDADTLDSKSLTCMTQLACGKWAKLQRLDLSCCGVSLMALRALTQGNWPRLHYLDLSYNWLLPDRRSCRVLKGNSKQQIGLCCNHLRPTKRLAGGLWPELNCINLEQS